MDSELGRQIGADLLQMRNGASSLADGAGLVAPAQDGPAGARESFASRMMEAVHGVNRQDHEAAGRMAAVDSGASDDLVGAMLASQQASLSFSMLMQVRNKVMGAVDDLVKLPI